MCSRLNLDLWTGRMLSNSNWMSMGHSSWRLRTIVTTTIFFSMIIIMISHVPGVGPGRRWFPQAGARRPCRWQHLWCQQLLQEIYFLMFSAALAVLYLTLVSGSVTATLELWQKYVECFCSFCNHFAPLTPAAPTGNIFRTLEIFSQKYSLEKFAFYFLIAGTSRLLKTHQAT